MANVCSECTLKDKCGLDKNFDCPFIGKSLNKNPGAKEHFPGNEHTSNY